MLCSLRSSLRLSPEAAEHSGSATEAKDDSDILKDPLHGLISNVKSPSEPSMVEKGKPECLQ